MAAGAIASAGTGAETQMQPPMNDFYEAFYTCESGGAFLVSYDFRDAGQRYPDSTSDKNKKYQLKRAARYDRRKIRGRHGEVLDRRQDGPGRGHGRALAKNCREGALNAVRAS